MARAMVVVESMFGNTESVARAVANGLSSAMQVDVVSVTDAPPVVGGVQLLIVGAPTHAFGMSRASTRQEAVKQGAHPTGGPDLGLREWLAQVRQDSGPVCAAAFDTRVKKRGVPGSAARGAQRQLRRRGFPIATPAKSFYVDGTPGPLLDGELERARQWGAQLGYDQAKAPQAR
jgi:Flavodoxin